MLIRIIGRAGDPDPRGPYLSIWWMTVQPAPPGKTGITAMETLLQNLLPVSPSSNSGTQQGPGCWDWTAVLCFSCGKTGHGATRCPTLDVSFLSFLAVRMEGGEGRERIRDVLSSCGSGAPPGISNGTGPQDHCGSETWLTAPREQPNPRLAVERSNEVEVATVMVEATRGRMDCSPDLPSQMDYLW